MKSKILGLLALGVVVSAPVLAGPIKMSFTYDGDGSVYSGFVTWDSSQGETGLSSSTLALSNSGCQSYVNGACMIDLGSNPPVVLDYGFDSPFGFIDSSSPWGTLGWTESYRWNVVEDPEFRAFGVSLNQILLESYSLGDISVRSIQSRGFSIIASGVLALIPDPENLDSLWDMSITPGRLNFATGSFLSSCVGSDCSAESYFQGHDYQILSAQVTNVPEPGTLALFAASLCGLVLIRRRKKSGQRV